MRSSRFLLCSGRTVCWLAFLVGGLATGAEDTTVQMAPFRVTPSDFRFDVEYAADTQAVVQLRISWVEPESGADQRGLRKGDCIALIDGVPVTSLKRSDVVRDGKLIAREEVTFEGKRGLLGKKWSLTGKLPPRKEKESSGAPAAPAR